MEGGGCIFSKATTRNNRAPLISLMKVEGNRLEVASICTANGPFVDNGGVKMIIETLGIINCA